jgi:WYL domain
MPKSKKQLFRFHVIDNELWNRSWVKTSVLKKIIEENLHDTLSERTIQKDIDDMKFDTRLKYYAPIEYDNSKKAHRYTDKNYSIDRFALQTNEINALRFYASSLQHYSNYGLFKVYSNAIGKVINGINIKQNLKDNTNPNSIIQTDTNEYSAGIEFLELIVQAIDAKDNICFLYEKFNSSGKMQERTISPYLLKEYRNRWYVLGAEVKNKQIKTFGCRTAPGFCICFCNFFQPWKIIKHSNEVIEIGRPMHSHFSYGSPPYWIYPVNIAFLLIAGLRNHHANIVAPVIYFEVITGKFL